MADIPADLLTAVEAAAATTSWLNLLDEGEHLRVGELWERSARAAAWIAGRAGSGVVAMLLDTSSACIASVLGAWRAGLDVVSLPLPPRGGDLEWYADYLIRTVRLADASLVLVDEAYLPFIPDDLGVVKAGFSECLTGPPGRVPESSGRPRLIQFTSGSTSDPKGVVLTLDQVHANVLAILEVLEPEPGDTSVSWLPLSHDMGLVGMLLSSLVAAGPRWVNGGEIALMQPQTFIRRPQRWLDALSELGGTITAAPDFAFHLAMQSGWSHRSLGSLRACITGGEQVRATTLRSFSETFADTGFRSRAFCPAYGLAEAGLAVSMVAPGEDWTTLEVSEERLNEGVVERSDRGKVLVGAGRPLPGYRVGVESPDDGTVGLLTVEGPSVTHGYLGEPPSAAGFRTADLGFFDDERIFVVGRRDDVVLIGGKKLALGDVDEAMEETGAVAPGRAAGAFDETLGLIAAAELRESDQDARDLARRLAASVAHRTGHRPRLTVILERSTLPRTTSGKPRREELVARINDGTLPFVYRVG